MMAIVTDLDDTLILGNDEANTPMLNLLLDAHQRGERIIVVSGRSLNRLDETKDWLDEHGLEVADGDIHLSDFPSGPNASEAFKVFKAKKLLDDGVKISAWYENDADTRRKLQELGVNTVNPASVRALSPATPGAPVPTSFGVKVDTQAPQEMRDNAHDGLKFYAMGKGGDGLTPQTIREARDMVKGIVTNDKWKRIAAWVARHRVDWEDVPQNHDMKDPNFPGAGAVAAYLWGVDPTDPGSADDVIEYAKKAIAAAEGKDANMGKRAVDAELVDAPSTDVGNVVDASLAAYLKRLLGDVFTLYTTAHGFHWNVLGAGFPQFHELFEEIYEDVYSSIDPIAENVRKLNDFPPFRLPDLVAVRAVEDVEIDRGDGVALAGALAEQNSDVIDCLNAAFDKATADRQQGIANFLAERIDQHQKWAWQLSAVTGVVEAGEPSEVVDAPDSGEGADLVAKLAELYKQMQAGD